MEGKIILLKLIVMTQGGVEQLIAKVNFLFNEH